MEIIFDCLKELYNKVGTIFEGSEMNSKRLLSSQQYQVSNQIIQEKVYETLESVY